MNITLVPAYGKDYKSVAEVKAAWDAGKDFIICNPLSRWYGKPINKEQAITTSDTYSVRYAKKTKSVKVQ